MLPITLLPSGTLASMRAQAASFFTTPVSVYETTLTYNAYGQQIVASGLRVDTTGYVGKVSGKDKEILDKNETVSISLTGVETESLLLVLVPYAYPLLLTDTIVVDSTEYRVIWTNKDTQDSVQLYQKAICARKVVIPEKRFYNG